MPAPALACPCPGTPLPWHALALACIRPRKLLPGAPLHLHVPQGRNRAARGPGAVPFCVPDACARLS